MELLLRPPARRFHPLMRPRRGFEGLGLTPGYTPAQQAMADQFAMQFGTAPPAVYQAPAVVPVPACSQDTQPGGAAFSSACIAQVLAAQQQNMAADTAANYDVDRANCETAWAENDARYASLGLPRPPNTCAQRTYGLTLPGTTGGTNTLLTNAPAILDPNYAGPGAGSGGAVPGGSQGSGGGGSAPSLSFTNLTSGDNRNFKVGDRWQITITGAAPNSAVFVAGGQNGASANTQMGTTDASGNFSLNGQMDQSQIGNWSETWRVGATSAGSFTFVVAPAGTASGSAPSTSKTSASTPSIFGTLPGGSVDIGGTSVPWLAIGAGVLVLVLMMRK